ncbi:MAG: chromosome segregation protein SMC [candidate division KSB1 bacterium]|nr:chromosome segregation protein SMC [candidate division KSB1 bacterium]
MKLVELNIVGFKSFAKKTHILMHDGITAIVGPNGCGKSNIVDAIRWVMGEQRTSALRSEKMDNVIFSGSASAKAVGMAEVSLRIENDDNRLPVDYSEVVITRRLFRSGESQYLINGNQCRLKDINDLFMDTGMTGQSYSVIELPQVDKILNGAPEERSRIFEEAAGITKFKQRRRLTLRKLDATEKDLNRVNDILAEVEKKVRSLQRQVTKARRYQELSEELKDQDIKLATHDYVNLIDELEPLETKRNHLVDEREEVMASLSNKEADFESCKTRLLELEQKLSHEQSTYNNYYKNIQKFEERVLVNKERIRSLEEMQKRYDDEREHLVEQLNSLEQDLDQANYETKRVKKDLDAAKEQYATLNTEYQSVRQDYDDKRAAFKDKEAEILYITEQISSKLNEGERLRATEESLSQRMQDIDAHVTRQKEQFHDISRSLSELRTAEAELTQRYEQTLEHHTQAERKANEARSAADGLRKTDLQDQNRIEVLENNAEMIRKVLENYQDYPSGVRYLATLKSDNFKSFGTVANALHVDSEHRTAISAALGEAAAYLIVNNINDATTGIGLLQQERKGVVSFLPLEAIPDGHSEHPHIEDLGVVDWADQVVRCQDRFRPILNMLLTPFLIVQDLETANRLYETAAGKKVNLVTLAGEVLGHWGLIRGGSHSKRQSDFVGRQEELEQIQNEMQEIKQASERRQQRIQELDASETETRQQAESLQEELKNLEQELSRKRVDLGRVEYEYKSIRESIETQTSEKQELFKRVTAVGKI